MNLIDLFISPALADTGMSGGFDFMGILPLALVFVVMYFLLIRPQQKKSQQLRQMQQHLKRGDRVLLNGGLFGEVVKVLSPEEVSLEIADGVKVRAATSMIGTVLTSADRTSQHEPTANEETTLPAKRSAPAKKTTSTAAKKTTITRKSAAAKKTSASKRTASKTTKTKTKARAAAR